MSFDMRGTTEKPTVEGQLFSFEELSKDSEDMVQEYTEAGTEVCGNEKGSELGIEADEDVPLKLEKELVCLKDKTQKQDQVIEILMSTVISLRDQVAAMQKSLDASLSKPWGSPEVPPDSICFTVVNKAKEVLEWTNEIDYPPDDLSARTSFVSV